MCKVCKLENTTLNQITLAPVSSKRLSYCIESDNCETVQYCISHVCTIYAAASNIHPSVMKWVQSVCVWVGGWGWGVKMATHTSVYDGRQLGNVWIHILSNPLPQVCVHLLCLWKPGWEGEGRERGGEGRGGEGRVHVQPCM